MRTKALAVLAAMVVSMSGALASAAPASAAPGVCSGVKGCKVVSRADVDGDRRTDQVGLVQRKANPAGSTVTVRVRTAKGRTMSTRHTAWWYGSTWHGAAKVDKVAGHDLVVGTSVGAHYMQFRVITVRRGKLVTLKAPGKASRWGIDSSYSFNEGWTRAVSRAGTVSMTSRFAKRRNASTHTLTTKRYIWRASGWARTSSAKKIVSNRSGMTVGGWRVPYLKRYPRF